MIRIVREGICKDCTQDELELISFDYDLRRIWEIRCKHAPACARVIQVMMDPEETK